MKAEEMPASASQPRRLHRPGRLAATVMVAGLLACVSPWSLPQPVGHQRTASISGAGSEIGAERCGDCHGSYGEHFVSSDSHPDCESCHGPGQLHAHTARMGDIRYPSSEDCASCHQIGATTLLGWTTSPHARANVICSDCHNTHNRKLWNLRETDELQTTMLRRADTTTRMCVSCHAEVRAQFDLPSHHPIGEGMLGCSDCHDPHESRRQALGARPRMCTECHQEVAGPWIYEHPPVNENCGHCHAPHGTSADFLLKTSQPAACISCHTLATAGAVHQPYAFTTDCTDCHNAVHGSYSDPYLRK